MTLEEAREKFPVGCKVKAKPEYAGRHNPPRTVAEIVDEGGGWPSPDGEGYAALRFSDYTPNFKHWACCFERVDAPSVDTKSSAGPCEECRGAGVVTLLVSKVPCSLCGGAQ